MSLKLFAAVGLLATSLALTGCDQNASTTSTDTATPSAGATGDKARSAASDLKMQAEGAGHRADAAMGNASTQASDAANSAGAAASDTGNAIVAQAQSLYEKATAAISNTKFDDAQGYVDQLKAIRDKLPAEWQAKVDQLGTMLTDAKAKMGNLKMPSMPK